MDPILSIAIIFKNEIRCLERCMRSLQPLQERISCELIMADTGSTDGSRAIAESYADVVFDFPWINDFSAARNAVFDRCSGEWALILDCDEWLDGNIEELVTFLKSKRADKFDEVVLTIRNYSTVEMNAYGDSRHNRLVRLALKPRYRGTIHERMEFPQKPRSGRFERTILHHDGYIMLNDGSAAGKAKRARNIALIRGEMKRNPNDLRLMMELLESGDQEPDYLAQLRRATALVGAKSSGWREYGPPIMRYAVQAAYNKKLPELDEWADKALIWYPDSFFTTLDVEFILTLRDFDRENFAGAAQHGERFLRARKELGEKCERGEMLTSVLQRNDGESERDIRMVMARALLHLGREKEALSLLENWAWAETNVRQVQNFIITLQEFAANSHVDIMPLLLECREGIRVPQPSLQRAAERIAAFNELCTIRDGVPTNEPLNVSSELRMLADKIKMLLDKFPPQDPAVIELKNSEAYKRVAYLIEE